MLPLFLAFFHALQSRRPKINVLEMIETATMIFNLFFVFKDLPDTRTQKIKKREQFAVNQFLCSLFFFLFLSF